jgi:3-oxoacyl-[acyl-carrier protein] reductase
MSNELAGRVAVVTGAGRNIGRAIALALADAGAAVAVNGRAHRAEVDAVVAEIESRGGKALAVMADVSDEAAVQRMATAAAERLGRIDILVNNAAVRPEKPFESLSLADWRAVHSVILEGAFLTVKAALPHLKASGVGAIVNIGGMSAHTGAKDRAHVLAAKSGLIGFTKGLAHDLANYGITANCVVPGLVDTVRAPGTLPPQHHQSSKTLTGRFTAPREIAAAVRFLAGPDARSITGQSLHVNGGAYLD